MVSSFPLVSFLITLLLVCTYGQIPILDTDGNDVVIGQKYFIQPVKTSSNNGGGLVPAAITLLPFCPLGITQTPLPYQPGLPVSFKFSDTVVKAASTLNIEFKSDIWPFCNEFSKLWAVDDSSSASNEPAIIIGGKPGNRNSEFKIQSATGAGANTYILTSLAGFVGATPGIWPAPQLILTNDDSKALIVRFKKVDEAITTTTTSTSRVEKLGLRMFPFY